MPSGQSCIGTAPADYSAPLPSAPVFSPPGAGSVASKSDDIAITRISRACERCRRRKIRCNGAQPCAGCSLQPTACVYRNGRSRVRNQGRRPPIPAPREPPELPSNPAAPVHTPEQPKPQSQWYRRCYAGISVINHTTSSFQVYGPSSQLAFLQRVYERLMMCQTPGLQDCDAQNQIPTAIRNWELERFLFSMPPTQAPSLDCGIFLSRNLGDFFIRSYFKLVHPQVPILDYHEVASEWAASWSAHLGTPEDLTSLLQRKQILFLVLAIGARVCPNMDQDGFKMAEAWAEHFSRKVELPLSATEEPSMHLLRIFLLKAIFAQHVLRINDAYMYLGCAARTAVALGINRSLDFHPIGEDAAQGTITFWATYSMERITALMIGRPSSLRDEHIDIPYPLDSSAPVGPRQASPCGVITDSAYVRAMAMLGGLADQILTGIYHPEASPNAQHFLAAIKIMECEARWQDIVNQLPARLDLLNAEAPVGEHWQEVQRLHLGIMFDTMRMLIHRPALVFTTFFSSITEAQSHTALQLRHSIELCVGSAKSVIRFTYESMSSRVPEARSDGSSAIFLVTACLTLLFYVLDPSITLDSVRDGFLAVNQAMQCLEDMRHLGPAIGKKLSLDIMNMAQNIISSPIGQALVAEDQGLMAEYPWLE
ncbi:hypothetical protein FOYG_16969 [Fusarium oxysporum NRRL 32931]|uniref:Zn(2)-C6 fungal-type domain-containing protein n=1 Tax=Fusarium oxysporum NRRL 32931 TaxID=660029 RepID=W9HFZ2_FUSOX|nr:hypothetical protein FOYG_16969 [Fusarium oxysporum NRRL 32931]